MNYRIMNDQSNCESDDIRLRSGVIGLLGNNRSVFGIGRESAQARAQRGAELRGVPSNRASVN